MSREAFFAVTLFLTTGCCWLVACSHAANFSGSVGASCPFSEDKRPINQSSFEYLCPGGNASIEHYFLYGFLGSFQPNYNGVGMIIAGAIPYAVQEVNE